METMSELTYSYVFLATLAQSVQFLKAEPQRTTRCHFFFVAVVCLMVFHWCASMLCVSPVFVFISVFLVCSGWLGFPPFMCLLRFSLRC